MAALLSVAVLSAPVTQFIFDHSSCSVLCPHIHSQLIFYYLCLYFLPLYTVPCHFCQSLCSPDRSRPECLQRRWTAAETTCRYQNYSSVGVARSCDSGSRVASECPLLPHVTWASWCAGWHSTSLFPISLFTSPYPHSFRGFAKALQTNSGTV